MRDEFKDIMDKVIDEGLVGIIIDRDNEGRTYITLNQPSLLKVKGSVFIIPHKMSIMIDDLGVSIRELSQCEQCENKDHCVVTTPIGTEDELIEYMESRERDLEMKKASREALMNTVLEAIPVPEDAIDMSVFRNRGGNC